MIDRTRPPATPPIPSFKMPPAEQIVLPNGLRVVTVEDTRFPLVNVRLSFQAGSKFDSSGLPGLAAMSAGLLTQGTATRSFRDIAEELTSIGATLGAGASPDVLSLSGSVLAGNTACLLDLLADVTLHASFPENEVQLRKQNRKQQLLAQRSQASFLASEKFDALVFGDHPYARTTPTMESLDRMDRDAIVRFRDAHLAANNAVLLLVGRLPSRDQTLAMVRDRFGAWESRPLPAAPVKDFPQSRRRLALIDRPGSAQADIYIGRLAATRTDPDYYPQLVGNAILGGGASSRLFADVREKRGFAYDAHSELDRRMDAGAFTAVTQVRNEVVEEAIGAVLFNIAEMGKSPVTAAELEGVKNYMSGGFLISLETQAALADQIEMVKTMKLPDDYLEMFTSRVRAVEPAQIQEAACKYLSPERAVIVVVGNASDIRKSVEKFGELEVERAK